MSNTYICAVCKGEFEKGWSDEEALKEKNENFGNIKGFSKIEDCDLVCDDCYKKMTLPKHLEKPLWQALEGLQKQFNDPSIDIRDI